VAKAEDNIKNYEKVIKEAKDLTKGLQADIADSFNAGLTNAIGQIKVLEGQTTKTAKAQKKLYEDSIDLTKDILENVSNIGTEEFKTLDVATKLAKARKLGDEKLIDQLKHLKSINQQQKQQNKQIQAVAAIAKKPFEAVDSFIRQIPVIGDLLSSVADFTGLGDSFATGIVEGFTSGFVENANLAGKVSDFFADGVKGAFGQKLTEKQIAAGFGGKKAKEDLEKTGKITGGIVDNFKNAGIFGKGFQVGIVASAIVVAKMAASMVSFANSTGLAYKDTLAMGGSLLVNANAVKAFSNEMGTANNLTMGQSIRLKIMEKRFGLTAESAAKLFATQRGITGQTMDQFLATQETNAGLIRQAGLLPQKVFDDMAQNAEAIALFTDATGDNMFKAAMEASKFGLSLSDTTKMAEGLMDFETSIKKEMEASVLLGKQVNFNKARELIMANDITGAQQAVREQLVGIGDLSQLNMVQRKAIADAANLELSAVSKLINPQESLNAAQDDYFNSLFGSMAIGAALIGTVMAGVMALKAVLSSGASLLVDTGAAAAGAGAGMLVGAGIGAAGGALYHGLTQDFPSLQSGGDVLATGFAKVHEGESVGNLDKTERHLAQLVQESKKLREQNEFLMNRLTNKFMGLGMG